MYLISVMVFILIVFLQTGAFGGSGMKIAYLIDFPSLLLIALLTLPIVMAAGMLKDFFHAFGVAFRREIQYTKEETQRALIAVKLAMKMFLGAGCLLSIMSIVSVLRRLDDPSTLGPSITVAMLSLLYGLILAALLLPVSAKLQAMVLEAGEEER